MNLITARHCKCPNMNLVHIIIEETNGVICKLYTKIKHAVHLYEGIMTVLVRNPIANQKTKRQSEAKAVTNVKPQGRYEHSVTN